MEVSPTKNKFLMAKCWLRQHFAMLSFGFIGATSLMFSQWASQWHPMPVNTTRFVEDERGCQIGLPGTIRKVAVFMAIGMGEYVLVTGRPGQILTSESPVNERIKTMPLLRRAFSDIHDMRTPMSSAETGTVNLEVLLHERPDVLVTWSRIADNFERVGLSVTGLGPVSSPQRLIENTTLFSAIAGQPHRAIEMIQHFRQEQKRIAEDVAARVHDKTSLLLLIGMGEGQWRVGYGFNDIIEAAGGRKIGAELSQRLISAEQLLTLAPDVILILGGAGLDDQAPQRLMNLKALQPLPAISNRRVYATPPGVSGYMSTLIELPVYMQWLAEVLHPNELGHNVKSFARQVYANALGVEPTDDDLDDILAVNANRFSAFQSGDSSASEDPRR